MHMRTFLIGSALALLAACDRDPMERPGTWRPTQANEANLRAMVADPADLTRGRTMTGAHGAQASRPITQLQAGRRPPLPRVTASQIGILGLTPVGGGNAPR